MLRKEEPSNSSSLLRRRLWRGLTIDTQHLKQEDKSFSKSAVLSKNQSIPFKQLESNHSSLKTLHIANKDLDFQTIRRLSIALQTNTCLEQLYFEHVQLSLPCLDVLAQGLKVNASLSNLQFKNNNIDNHGCITIIKALETNNNCKIELLRMTENNIGNEGVTAIAQFLKHNNSLKIASLTHCNIDDEGAKSLADAIEKNSILCNLILSSNKITDIGATYFAKSLIKNTALEYLQLNYNHITTQGVEELHTVFKFNNRIVLHSYPSHCTVDIESINKINRANTKNLYFQSHKTQFNFELTSTLFSLRLSKSCIDIINEYCDDSDITISNQFKSI